MMNFLNPSKWFRKEPDLALPSHVSEGFVPADDPLSIRFYSRIKHDMTSPVSPSRFEVFRDKPVEEVERLMSLSWAEHWYGRMPTREEINYVFSGQFDKDEAQRKGENNG
jgi:hypothetical protein